MYHNTLPKEGKELKMSIVSSKVQDRRVLKIIEGNKESTPLTPRIVWAKYLNNHGNILLTSVRRSINTLIRIGLLDYVWTGEYYISSNHEKKKKYSRIKILCGVDNIETSERIIVLVKKY